MSAERAVEREKLPPFLETLKEVEQGQFQAEASEKLTQLIKDVVAYGAPGTFSLSLKFSTKGNQVIIDGDINIKAPKPARSVTVMFATVDGRLTRRDPRQPMLTGVVVPIEGPEVKE
jgi:hypothetical protein